MKCFDRVLADDLMNEVLDELKRNLDGFVWKPSSFFWPPGIRNKVNRDCLITACSKELNKKLEQAIQNIFIQTNEIVPDYEVFYSMFYMWQKGSAISIHNDSSFKFGATIYLNETWSPDDGGIFLWRRKNEDERLMQAVVPSFNFMVLNNNFDPHLTTPVSELATQPRMTLQLFGK